MSRQSITEDNLAQNGVLTKMVQQPVDNAIEISWQDGAKYTERWKGPYDAMKGVTATGGTVKGATWLVGYARPSLGADWASLIGMPTTTSGMNWMIDTIEVTEEEAGAHGIFEVTYKAVPSDILPQGGYGSKPTSSSTSTEVVTETTGWTLRWGTYSRNVLEYCTKEPNDHTGQEDESSFVAHADHVIKCAQLPKPRKNQIPSDWRSSSGDHPVQYMWVEPNQAGESVSADVKELCNEKEREIYNYYTRGIQPVFHYPILTYTQTYEYPLSETHPNFDVQADKVDEKIQGIPNNCPFNLPNWEWVHCGTEAQTRRYKTIQKSTFQITKTTTWEGAWHVDDHFYGSRAGNDRWEPGTYSNGTPVT